MMGGLFALGIVACVSGLIYSWNGIKPRRFEAVDQHRRQMEALAPEELS